MKKSQLEELIRHVTRKVMKEFMNIDPTSNSSIHNSSTSTSPDKINADSMNNQNNVQNTLDAEKERLKNIRTGELGLKGMKKQTDYFKQQVKQNDLAVRAKEKELQNLKANKTISVGGAGSISAE